MPEKTVIKFDGILKFKRIFHFKSRDQILSSSVYNRNDFTIQRVELKEGEALKKISGPSKKLCDMKMTSISIISGALGIV